MGNNRGKNNIFGMNAYKNNGGLPGPVISRQTPGGTMGFNQRSESVPGFTPGRPRPSGTLPGGTGVKYTNTSTVNSKPLIKRLNNIKDQLGVFSNLNYNPGVPRSMFVGSNTSQFGYAGSQQPKQPVVQHFHVSGGAPSSIGSASTMGGALSSMGSTMGSGM